MYVTRVVPTPKPVPGAWLRKTRLAVPLLSVAVGSNQVTAVLSEVAVTVISWRQSMTGRVVSVLAMRGKEGAWGKS